MDRSKPWSVPAVTLAALLHLLIVAFLYLATLSCTDYESGFGWLHLPASWNPITCSKPLQLQGQIIEATLMGPTGSPPPRPTKAKPVPNTVPPPPAVPPPPVPPVEQPKIKTLPPPPEHPDVVDQERVVQEGLQKAEDAKKEQEEKQRQRAAELDAQAAKQKQEELKKIDELFTKMDAAADQRKKLDSRVKQAQQQLADLKNAQDNGEANLPNAAQRQTGNNSQNSTLSDEYAAAIQNAVTQNWFRPDNMPSVPCVVHIEQIPGGTVLSAKVDPSCPYDDAGKRSVENAVLRAQPLPYKGFESVFSPHLTFTFMPR
jgi:colicin import membrane protein